MARTMVARLPHPNAVPATMPRISPMLHPVRQCSVALNDSLLSKDLSPQWFPFFCAVLLDPQKPFDGRGQLLYLLVGAFAVLDGLPDAALDVVLQQEERDLFGGTDDARKLGEDIHAVGFPCTIHWMRRTCPSSALSGCDLFSLSVALYSRGAYHLWERSPVDFPG